MSTIITLEEKKLGEDLIELVKNSNFSKIKKFIDDENTSIQISLCRERNYPKGGVLHYCTNYEIFQYLMKYKCDPEMKDMDNWSPLVCASENGVYEIVKYLIESWKVDINCLTKRQSALHRAAGNGHLDIVKYLVAKGADTTIKNIEGETAMDASKLEYKEIYDFFMNQEKILEEKNKLSVNEYLQLKECKNHVDIEKENNKIISEQLLMKMEMIRKFKRTIDDQKKTIETMKRDTNKILNINRRKKTPKEIIIGIFKRKKDYQVDNKIKEDPSNNNNGSPSNKIEQLEKLLLEKELILRIETDDKKKFREKCFELEEKLKNIKLNDNIWKKKYEEEFLKKEEPQEPLSTINNKADKTNKKTGCYIM